MQAILVRIQQIVHKNASSLANLNLKMDTLVAKKSPVVTEVNTDNLEDILRRALPLKSMEEFKSLQEELKVNHGLRKKLGSILVLVGGKDTKDTCQNMMRKLMNDDLAQKFTYKGKLVGKSRFADTEISDVLNSSIRSIVPGHLSTDDKIKDCVSEWLTQAKFREQKRERRKKSQDLQPFVELNFGPTFQSAESFQNMLDQMHDTLGETVELEEI